MLLNFPLVKKYTLALVFGLLCFAAKAQAPKDAADQKYKQALQLEDDENYADAIALLTDAQKLNPANINYPYEIAYALYSQKQYQKAIDKLLTLKNNTNSFDRLYQLLGKSYIVLDEGAKALAIYTEGLKKFPKSGCLYLERGTIPLDDKNYDEALQYFEKGIEVEPGFASNYYWAAKLYCNSTDPVWGVLYAELFMNLERNGPRNNEISKLLYDTYNNQITFAEPGKPQVTFTSQVIVEGRKPDKMPYPLVYQPTMGAAAATETAIDINSLDRIRQNFLKFYNQRGFNKTYPNVLFNYQDKITKAGCIEAYNHWLLLQGNQTDFTTWRKQNPAKWQDFLTWFAANPLKLDEDNKFYRAQY
ncbi:anaphase-promoting complex subunit 3 [Mucilaginibacter gracilis]|uniref:Anaphase-promoting complex subunit 3 n=1 Tax=Mucilaginibacter gracilis TaxID=423350 RepID=A0A495J793_9SPHI|nr:tetratricopeptide repeat protein [Mucilaginibacter gracilis]RKR84860.1 anaphase-promoting complex subunit 3 [Mucilaginibacter gracilis]